MSDSNESVAIDNGDEYNAEQSRLSGSNQEMGSSVLYHADSKEDLFMDAPEELSINADSREVVLSATDNEDVTSKESYGTGGFEFYGNGNGVPDGYVMNAVVDKESPRGKSEEIMENVAKDVANLWHELKALVNQQSASGDGELVDGLQKEEMGESNNVGVNAPLHEMIHECSKCIRSALQERSQIEATMRELHAILYHKDQQLEELNAKVGELSQSVETSPEHQVEKTQHVEAVTNRMLASIVTVLNQEEMGDDSASEKIDQAEKGVSLLIEKYGQILNETEQLRQCLSQADSANIRVQEEFGSVFFNARNELLELKRKEVELMEYIGNLENENRKFAEKIDLDQTTIETLNEEIGKLKTELEQERTRSANTKEKLSMAVTKGKALVQQRDSLKQSLAAKTNELEACLVELQQKSNALEVAEQTKEELARSEQLVASLQEELSQRNSILERFEELWPRTDEHEEIMSTDVIERYRYIVNELKDKKEKLVKSEEMVVSLQEMLSRRDEILGNFEEILSGESVSEEVQSLDVVERLKWLIHEKYNLKHASTDLQKLKDMFSSIEFPDSVSSYDLESCAAWLKESLFNREGEISMFKDEIARTREAAYLEIDRMSALLSAELQEKEYLQKELDDLECRYKELQGIEHQSSLEKDRLVRRILDIAGNSVDDQDGVHQPPSEITMLIDRCFERVREQKNSFSHSSVDAQVFETIQSHLYVRNLDLTLCENILEEEVQFRSDANTLSSELNVVSRELVSLKEERDSLQRDLERAEEKMTLLREKLSMAVKKGKGLVQDRENLKNLLEEKNSEIENLKLDLQQQESLIADSRGQMSRLSTDLERIPKLEADIVTLQEERNQFEKFLLERNSMLQRVIESVDSIVLPVDSVFDKPTEKVQWIAGYLNDCQDAKIHAEQEVEKLKEEGNALASGLEEAKTTIKSREGALSAAQSNISRLTEEKREIELGKANLEQELQKTVDEARTYSSKVSDVFAAKESLEEALSQAESRISMLINEKEDAMQLRGAAETELEKAKEEMSSQSSRLAEANKTIKSLEDALSHLEANFALLTEQNNDVQAVKAHLETELKRLQEEAESQAQDDLKKQNKESLEDALLQAENKISTLINEKEDAILLKGAAESELEKAKEEISSQSSRLAEANKTIKSLEDALSKVEANVALLTEQNSDIQAVKAHLETELKRLQDEVESQTQDELKRQDKESLDDALLQAENRISMLINEKEDAILVKGAAESELEKAKEEISSQSSRLAEANRTIKSLEDALSYSEANIALLTEQNNDIQVVKSHLETELKRLQEESESLTSNLAESSREVKSLEDALSKAENDISLLETEKKSAEQELSTLNSKLNACMEELAGTHGNFKSRSLELIGHVNDLQALVKDGTIFSLLKQSITKNINSLKDIDNILKSIRDRVLDSAPEILQSRPGIEDDLYVVESLSYSLESIGDIETEFAKVDAESADNISSYLSKTVEDFQLRDKILAEKTERFSSIVDKSIAALLMKSQATRDDVVVVFEYIESLKQQVETVEAYKQEKENTTGVIENDVMVLQSACTAAIRDLQFEVGNDLLGINIIGEAENLTHILSSEGKESDCENVADHQQKADGSQHVNLAQQLLLAARKAQTKLQQFEKTSNLAASTIKNLQNKLEETRTLYESAVKERDCSQSQTSQLQNDLERLRDTCTDLRTKLEYCHVKENKLKEREEELLKLQDTLSRKDHEMESSLLSASQTKVLFEKINRMDFSIAESEFQDMDRHSPTHIKKLFYVIDTFTELQHQMNLLALDKEELQTSLTAKKTELEHLKEEMGKHINYKQDWEKLKNQLSELYSGIGKLVNMLGTDVLAGDLRSADVEELLPLLQKQVVNMLSELETSKSNAQELNIELLESQKLADELSERIRFLEDSLPHKTQPEIIQERSTFEASSLPTGSEITEIEEAGLAPAGKSTVPPSPAAALVRNTRKGSAEHLVLNMDLESQRLINNEETDGDKGHVFKSLNTSGLVPKQGKLIADRVDGIWVSTGRILMNRPRARLGLIAYWLFLHIWVLGTIL